MHRSRLVFSTFCERREELEAEWTKLFLSTASEEKLKTSSRINDHTFLLETPSIANVATITIQNTKCDSVLASLVFNRSRQKSLALPKLWQFATASVSK